MKMKYFQLITILLIAQLTLAQSDQPGKEALVSNPQITTRHCPKNWEEMIME